MIKTEIHGDTVHVYSDAGLLIRQKGTTFPVRNAYERVGEEHEWEEVREDD